MMATLRSAQRPRAHLARQHSPGSLISLGQGLYYLTTGVWSLVSIGSFQKVTGPKTDLWLVKTVGSLVTVIGGVLLFTGFRRRVRAEVSLLAAGSAIALAAIDLVYVLRRRISPIYLLDGLAELTLVLGWITLWGAGQPRRRDMGGDPPEDVL